MKKTIFSLAMALMLSPNLFGAVTTFQNVTNIVAGMAPQPMPTNIPVVVTAFTPLRQNILGLSYNGTNAPFDLWYSYGTNAGQWAGGFQMNGYNTWGSDTNMSSVGTHTIFGNGSTLNMTTNTPGNGGTLGNEQTLELSQRDPKQGTFLCFNAPKSGNGLSMTMGSGVDAAIGLGGWAYGTNTLGNNTAIGYDMLLAINTPCNLHFGSTAISSPFGIADFYAYDNALFIHHWAKAINGQGCFGNAGYLDAMALDARNQTLTIASATTINTNLNLTGATNTITGQMGTTGGNQGKLNLTPSLGIQITTPSGTSGGIQTIDARNTTGDSGNGYIDVGIPSSSQLGNTNALRYVFAPLNTGVSFYIDLISGAAGASSLILNGTGTNNTIQGNSGAFIRTNFISGQLYTNTYGAPILVSCKAILNTAASTVGSANMCLEMLGNETNQSGLTTGATTLLDNYTNVLSGIVTNNGTYVFTNRSTGAGNSSAILGGQILIY